MESGGRTAAEKLIVFVAEGLGAGRFPVAPGTLGTLVGFAWIYLLLLAQNGMIYCLGTVVGFFASVWLGGRSEQILGRKDPGSIVIDEITALPLAFGGGLLAIGMAPFEQFLHGKPLLLLLVTFVAFRILDITKPWIIGQSQSLPGGWGLTVDDFLAALHVFPLTYLCAEVLR